MKLRDSSPLFATLMHKDMHSTLHLCAALCAVGLFATACSRERAHIVEEPRATREASRDYRGMIERVRNKQSPVQIQESLEGAIRDFQRDFSRLPTNLIELVQRRYLPELKQPPAGYAYTYDPVYGNIGLVPVTPDGLYRIPESATNQAAIDMAAPSLPPPPDTP